MELVTIKCEKCKKKFDTLDFDGHIISRYCDSCRKQDEN